MMNEMVTKIAKILYDKKALDIRAIEVTDKTIIADWFLSLYKDYGLRPYKVGYDAKFATEFITRMDQYGFETEVVMQSHEVMDLPNKMVEADLKSRSIIGNNELDKWCFGNAALKLNSLGKCLVVKIDGQVARKIDGAVTTCILWEVFRRHRTEFVNNLKP